jgi:hypothetical protein
VETVTVLTARCRCLRISLELEREIPIRGGSFDQGNVDYKDQDPLSTRCECRYTDGKST